MASLPAYFLKKAASCIRVTSLGRVTISQRCSRRWLAEISSKSYRSSSPRRNHDGEPITVGKKRGRPPKFNVNDLPAKKVVVKREEELPEVAGWDLPPLDMWRQYFPVDKSSLHRSVIRNPVAAAMLADKFVPEGSKDKIIIDACPGAVYAYHSFRFFFFLKKKFMHKRRSRPTYTRTS